MNDVNAKIAEEIEKQLMVRPKMVTHQKVKNKKAKISKYSTTFVGMGLCTNFLSYY